jgi:hypothetical protein
MVGRNGGMRPPQPKPTNSAFSMGSVVYLRSFAYPRNGASGRPAAPEPGGLCNQRLAGGRVRPVEPRSMRGPGRPGMHASTHGGDRRPASSGDFAARKCTPWPMVPGFGSGHPRAMRLLRTLRRSRGGHPALAWAFRYALAAVVVGAGILLIGPSPGVGWALIVFGGCLAILTSEPSTRRGGEADPGTAGSASRASRRGRHDRRIRHARGQRRASAASRRSRGSRSIAR